MEMSAGPGADKRAVIHPLGTPWARENSASKHLDAQVKGGRRIHSHNHCRNYSVAAAPCCPVEPRPRELTFWPPPWNLFPGPQRRPEARGGGIGSGAP